MRIADICTPYVIDIKADTSVRAAAEAMRKRHVGALVVTDKPNGERIPVGILTDRDIVLAVVAANVDADSLTVGDLMNQQVATCTEDEELFSAITTMRHRGVRRLPVLNAKGGLVGIVSADDIYAALGTHLRELSHALTREQVHEMELRT